MSSKNLARLALLLFVLAASTACQSPQEKALELRRNYQVQLNTWLLKEPEVAKGPLAPANAAAVDLAAKAQATDAATADPASAPVTPDAPAGPRRVEVLFDLVVSQRGSDSLPGITLDISQADPFQKEKKTYRHYLTLPKMLNGQSQQFSFSIQADDFVDGDVFSVSLLKNVAPADRAAYQELQ